MTGRLLRWLAAALAGAGGLGLEAVVLGAAGLSLGFARANALGLGAYVAGWAVGAFAAGRSSRSARSLLLSAGAASLAAGIVLPRLLIARGSASGGEWIAAAFGLLCLFVCGLPQGVFLPALARRQRSVSGLFAANLLGSVAGAIYIGFELVGVGGRFTAAAAAGLTALSAGGVGVLALRASHDSGEDDAERDPLRSPASGPRPGPVPSQEPGQVAGLGAWWYVGAATLWTIGLEWCTLRLAVLWIGSREAALSSVLAASLLSLAAGAALLPALLPRTLAGVGWAFLLALAGLVWPFFAGPTLTALAGSEAGDLLTALALVAPPLLPLGAVIPLLHRALSPGSKAGVEDGPQESGRRLGGLLLHEAWAALLAGPLVHWVLVPRLGVGGALGALAILALPTGWLLSRHSKSLGAALAAAGVLVAAWAPLAGGSPARGNPALQNPALEVVSFTEDSEFAVAVVDDGLLGERTLLTDTFRAAGDGRDYTYMQLLGHLPVLLHPDPQRVAVLALGTGMTLGAVSLHPRVGAIDVLEISPAVVDVAGAFAETNRGALADPRVRVLVGDGRRALAGAAGAYDVITLEPLLPDSPFGVYLYTEGFYRLARRALAPGGTVCQWVPPHALEPDVFDAVLDAFRRSFPWSGAWSFGSQVILIGGEGRPQLAPERFAPVRAHLEPLGISSPAGVAARFVSEGSGWRPVERRLSDGDPWIVFRDKPGGAAVLGWLGANLKALTAGAPASVPDIDWLGVESSEALSARRAAMRGLLLARIEHSLGERDLLEGQRGSAEIRRAVDRILLEVLPVAADDPEVEHFVGYLRHLRGMRDGVSRLRLGDGRGAVEALTTAVALRPERADAHLYMSTALQSLGLEEPSRVAYAQALERCPRILDTPAGLRALGLGLQPPDSAPQAP